MLTVISVVCLVNQAKKKARQRARKKEKKECNPAPVEENAEAESDDEIERLVAEVTRETERWAKGT